MKQRPRRILLHKLLLLSTSNNKVIWPALLLLCVGMFFVLCSIILWTGLRDVLAGKYEDDSIGSTYITISKDIPAEEKITEQKPQLFSPTEIRALASLDEVKDAGLFTSARFPVEVSLEGDSAKFSTSLFLEAVPDRFIDNRPVDWQWQSTTQVVPVIISTEFLNLYNYGYAANQGVPQLTKGTIGSLEFSLNVGAGEYRRIFKANVTGFSDRINSILVPTTFMEYANERFATDKIRLPSRLILEVSDPSSESFIEYIAERDYVINTEHLRWNRLRTVLNTAVAGMGILSLITFLLGCFVFYMFVQLTIAKASKNISLLLQLGYSSAFLKRFVYTRYVLLVAAIAVTAGLMAVVTQVRVAKVAVDMNMHIATFPGWEVWVALAGMSIVIAIALYIIIDRGENKSYIV